MTDRRALAVIVLLHLAIVAIVQPRGDFPLNDDWAYAQSVRWLLDEGRLRLSDWIAMNLAPQALAGGLLAAIFGFSFEALRHLTQVVALLGLVAAYAWFRASRLDERAALVATAAIASFPAWPVLANSFMTDAYGLALALPAATFFLRALESPSRGALAAATAFSVVGVLERQVALAIPFAFMAASLWIVRPHDARSIARAALPFIVALGAAAAYQAWLAAGPGVPEGLRIAQGRVLANLGKALVDEGGAGRRAFANSAGIAGYLGWFAAGWLGWWGISGANPGVKRAVLVIGAAAVAAAFALHWFPPYRENYLLDRAGIGPFILYDTVRGSAPLDRSPGVLWSVLAIPAGFAAAGLVVSVLIALWRSRRPRDADKGELFMALVVVAYLGPFIVTDYFERYLLYVLPFLLALWARLWPASEGRVLHGVALSWIAGTLIISSMATHDYFDWNRARWAAIRAAERMGGGPNSIDGGFEYGGFARFEARAPAVPEGKSWYWVDDDRFVVAFSPVAGYRTIREWTLRPWLPRSPRRVILLERMQ